jgi:hypothetical protein
MLAEWGIGEFPEADDKAQWITEAFQNMRTRFPRRRRLLQQPPGYLVPSKRSMPTGGAWPIPSGWTIHVIVSLIESKIADLTFHRGAKPQLVPLAIQKPTCIKLVVEIYRV